MAPEKGRNVRNKLITITLAVIFMNKMLKFYPTLFYSIYNNDKLSGLGSNVSITNLLTKTMTKLYV